MVDLDAVRSAYKWADDLLHFAEAALMTFAHFKAGIERTAVPHGSRVIPRGLANAPRSLDNAIAKLNAAIDREPSGIVDVIVDTEWILGISARPVRCHHFWVITGLEAATYWGKDIVEALEEIPDWDDNPPNWSLSPPEIEDFTDYLGSCRVARRNIGFISRSRIQWLRTRLTIEVIAIEKATPIEEYRLSEFEDCVLRALSIREPQTGEELSGSATGNDEAHGGHKKQLAAMVKKKLILPGGKGRGSQGYVRSDLSKDILARHE